ncbi:zinc finger protein 185 isoform X3 [Brachyhypopomus gauderio]|uniref:zinc finger protein 185 isoform X3 n=1 Tax=Brachyhypopomus gauderio TaxID=698409 RepID=UPI004042F8C2
MSKEGDRQSVFRTTKVRTALKGDSSWIQRSKGEPEEDEKPWVAEVRAGRLNGAGGDAESDATSKEQEARPPPSTDNSKTPSSGYLIRGVFTKTDTKLAQPSSANGHIGTSGFVKKASDGYKKIAPHTVRPNTETTEQSEPSLSTEEQDKRTEAASSVLKNSGSRQRSYVLSAAKKYESSEKPESSAPPITSFVAKRVVISEDEDSDPVEPKAEIPATPSSSSLVAQQSYGVEMSVDDPVPPVKKNVPSAPEPKPMDKPETTPTKSVTEPITTITTTAPVAEKDTFKTPEPKPQSSPKTSVTDQVPPVAQKDTSNTPDPKPQPTPKPSVTEPITTITTTAPVAEKDTFKTPEPKPQSTPKTSVTGPITTTAPVAQKDTFKTPEPKPQSTPKTSVIETITPTPVAKKDTFKTPEPKPQSTPKISVTEPITTITTTAPVAEKDTFKTPEPKPQSSPKTSIIETITPTAPFAEKETSKIPEPKPLSTPKTSVTEPITTTTPVAEKDTFKTPEPKPQSTPKTSVTEPITTITTTAPVAEKDTFKTPEPKPQSTPKTSVTGPITTTAPVAQKDTFKTPEPKPQSTPKTSIIETITPTAPVAEKETFKTPEPKPQSTPKTSVIETITAPVAGKDASKTPEPKPQSTPKTSVTEPITTITTTAPVAEKDTFKTPEPKPQSTPKTSIIETITPTAPFAEKETSKIPEPKPLSTPKTSVTEPITTITTTAPVAEKDTFKTPEPKPQSTPKTSVTGPITTTAPVAQKDTFKTPEPKPQSTPKTSVIETITPTPVAKKETSKTPEPKPQSTPKISVTEPITTITTTAPVAEKDTFKTPEPKPQSTPKTSVTEPITTITTTALVAEKDTFKTPEPKPQSTPKTSVPDPVLPASIAVQKTPQSKPRTEPPPPISVQKVEKTSNLNDVDLMDLTQSDPQKQVNPVPTTTDLLTGLGSSLPQSEKTRGSLDLLALDVIPIDTNSEKLSTDKSNAKVETTQMVVRSKDSKSVPEAVTSAALIVQKGPSKTPEPKSEVTPKQSVPDPVLPASIAVQKTPQSKPRTEPPPPISVQKVEKTSNLNDVDLMDLTQSDPQKQVNPVPTTTDLLTGLGSSLPQSEKTRGSLDLLALDVIPIDTNSEKLSTDKSNAKVETTQMVVRSKDSKSSTETVTITTTKTEIIKGNDLHHEYSSLPQSQKTLKSLDLLAEDVIPIDTRISINKPQSKVDTSQTVMYTRDSKSSLPQSERTKESLDLLGFDFMPSKENTDKYSSNKTQTIVETSQTVLLPKKDFTRTIERFDPIMSYRENMAGDVTSRLYDDFPSDIDITRSSDSVSPRNEWTPSTLLTTIKKRETKADPPPMADYTYSRVQDSHAQDTKLLDTDTKRSFVYVKEYVNLSELSTQNDVRDGDYLTSTTSTYAYSSPSSDGDYLTSTTSKYAYSSPSSANSSACTYCGRLVGNDAKITIEHLNISCHPECFKCGICSKPMGDFLDNMFLHRGTVHCENCYANVI